MLPRTAYGKSLRRLILSLQGELYENPLSNHLSGSASFSLNPARHDPASGPPLWNPLRPGTGLLIPSDFIKSFHLRAKLWSMPVERTLFPIFVREGRSRKKFKAGYINNNGEVVVPAAFDYGYPFREGLASFRKGDLWGAIDCQGNVVIPPCSGQPLVFTEKLAEFSSRAKCGVLNTAGQVLVAPCYRSISHYSGGMACFGSGERYGYIDNFGTEAIPANFEDARPFSEGLAAVKVAQRWGYIAPDGSTVIATNSFASGGWLGHSGRVWLGSLGEGSGGISVPLVSSLTNQDSTWLSSSVKGVLLSTSESGRATSIPWATLLFLPYIVPRMTSARDSQRSIQGRERPTTQ